MPSNQAEINARNFLEIQNLRTALTSAQRGWIKEKNKAGAIVSAAYLGAKDAMLSMGPIPKIDAPRRDRRKKAESALWHLTDFQGAKLTPTYNSEILKTRVSQFIDKAAHITEIQRADHPVRDCTILFGGDMIEGLFNFPQQPFEIDQTLFGQFTMISHLLVDVVLRALSIYEKVTVVSEWGNHGRIGSKRDAVPRSDNFDRMCYEMARQLLKRDPATKRRLVWEDCPEDVQRVEIGNYRALSIHGDEFGRSGYASKATITQHVNRWRSGAYPWEFRDVYCAHYHTHEETSLANGEGSVYFTGSTESSNRYASIGMSSSAVPSQRLHFIDPEEGRVSAQYKIWLT
jgi:hypothetical protein